MTELEECTVRSFNLPYIIGQSFRGLWRNKVMSLASILILTSCMLVLGAFSMLILNIDHNLEDLNLLNEIAAYVSIDSTEEEIKIVENSIKAIDSKYINDVQYISKEEALESEKSKFADYPNLFASLADGDNPYRASFIITYTSDEIVNDLIALISGIENVDKVVAHVDIARSLQNLKYGISYVSIAFMAVLLVVSLFIIINTIRIALYSRRKEISVMRYVGATNSFVTVPFIFEGVIMGIISSLIAFALQWFLYSRIYSIVLKEYRIISLINFGSGIWIFFAIYAVIGVSAGIIGSCISIKKYLDV